MYDLGGLVRFDPVYARLLISHQMSELAIGVRRHIVSICLYVCM